MLPNKRLVKIFKTLKFLKCLFTLANVSPRIRQKTTTVFDIKVKNCVKLSQRFKISYSNRYKLNACLLGNAITAEINQQ